MVAAGQVRARVVCSRLCVLGMISGACVCVAFWQSLCGAVGDSWMGFDVAECVGRACCV